MRPAAARSLSRQTKLVIMVEGDPALLNNYHAITVTGAKNLAGGGK